MELAQTDKLMQLAGGVCLVLGGVDTGKTVLIRRIADRLAASRPVGLVDCDPGQSAVGPPGCVGWRVLDGPAGDRPYLDADGIRFVGHVTPVGHLLQLISSLVRAVEAVRSLSETVLIDTPGYIAGGAAAALWWNVVKVVRPRSILALQRSGELEPILRGVDHLSIPIERIPVSPEVRVKSENFRRQYRQKRLEAYFENAKEMTLDLDDLSVQTYHAGRKDNWPGRIGALADADGEDRVLAIVRRVQDHLLTVAAPPVDPALIAAVTIGDFILPASE